MKALGTELSFHPSKSWATLLMAVASLVTAFTGAAILPETRATLTKNDVAVLALSFGALLVFAPMIYNELFFRKPFTNVDRLQDDEANSSPPQAPALGKESELRGYILTLLAASAGILGALLGQLALVFLLINEIEHIDASYINRWMLWSLLLLTVVYACVYVWRGVMSALQGEVQWGVRARARNGSRAPAAAAAPSPP